MKEMWEYLESIVRSGKVKPGTVGQYRQFLGYFVTFISTVRKKNPIQADSADIKAYLASVRVTHSRDTYYARYLTVRRFYDYLIERGLIAKSPAAEIRVTPKDNRKGWVRCPAPSNPA